MVDNYFYSQRKRTVNKINKNNYLNDSINKTDKSYEFIIKYPKDGIPDEYINPKHKEILKQFNEFICPICGKLLWEFIECGRCHFLFCSFCIKKSISFLGDKCPCCRKTPFVQYENKTVKKLIGNISIRCPYKECNRYILYSNYREHIEKCEFRTCKCNNFSCGFTSLESEMVKHKEICEYRLVSCQYCGKNVQKFELGKHHKEVCLEVFVTCPDCGVAIIRGEYKRVHLSNNKVECLDYQIRNYKKEIEELNERIAQKNKYEFYGVMIILLFVSHFIFACFF